MGRVIDDFLSGAPMAARKWTAAEDATALRMKSEGATAVQIAAALNRPLHGTRFRLQNLARPAPLLAAVRPVAAAGPQPAPPPVPVETAFVPSEGGVAAPRWLREIQDRLDTLGNAAPFTPAADLALCEALARGERGADVAAGLGVPLNVLRQRHIALLPDLGLVAQERLLAELRRRAG